MKSGWKLYDHGLVVPTNNAQRWQRAQPIFSYDDLPIWDGSSIGEYFSLFRTSNRRYHYVCYFIASY